MNEYFTLKVKKRKNKWAGWTVTCLIIFTAAGFLALQFLMDHARHLFLISYFDKNIIYWWAAIYSGLSIPGMFLLGQQVNSILNQNNNIDLQIADYTPAQVKFRVTELLRSIGLQIEDWNKLKRMKGENSEISQSKEKIENKVPDKKPDLHRKHK